MKTERIDILCLCTRHNVGGAQNVAGRLTAEFRERGYLAELGFLFEHDPSYSHGVQDYFVVADSRPRNVVGWADFMYRCVREIAIRRPRCALAFHPFSNVVGALMTGWQGNFVSTQAWPSFEQSAGMEKLESLLIRTPLISRNIAVSRFVASTFEHRGAVYRHKTTVVYNDPGRLVPIYEDTDACRSRFTMIKGAPVLGTLGRLHEQKNFQLAIRALQLVPRAHLYLAGQGPQENFLRNLASELGVTDRVHFVGQISGADITRFLAAVDLLLMTSIYEGHPLVMLEGMSAGTAILAHDIPVLRECGENAVIYASSDPEDWARKIREIVMVENADRPVRRDAGVLFPNGVDMVDRYLEVMGLPPARALSR